MTSQSLVGECRRMTFVILAKHSVGELTFLRTYKHYIIMITALFFISILVFVYLVYVLIKPEKF